MADEFNKEEAERRHDEYIREAQVIRDGLTKDVIDYYYNYYPNSEAEVREQKAGMRKYLDIAHDRITDLINRLR